MNKLYSVSDEGILKEWIDCIEEDGNYVLARETENSQQVVLYRHNLHPTPAIAAKEFWKFEHENLQLSYDNLDRITKQIKKQEQEIQNIHLNIDVGPRVGQNLKHYK